MYYTEIKHSSHLRTLEKCRKHSPAARVFYISLVFSNACRVLSQCNTRLRLLYLLTTTLNYCYFFSPKQSAGGHPSTKRYCRGRSTAKKPTYAGHTMDEFCRPSTKKAPSQIAYTTDVMSQRTAMFITIITKQTWKTKLEN